MKLRVKFLDWSAGFPVAMLDDETAKKIGVYPKDRVSIKIPFFPRKKLETIVDISNKMISKNEIGVSSELKEILKIKQGRKVSVNISPSPESLNFIKKKLLGKKLSEKEINSIISDVVSSSLSEAEIAMFVSAMYDEGMDTKETIYLIKSMLKSSHTINFDGKFVADKHCIGGIPGNRTTPIVVSICVAAGLTIPKSSSRAITSAAGTADVIECLAKVSFSPNEVKRIVKKTGGCLVWGGSLEMLTADTKIIQIEKTLKLDPEAQLLASIISKKLAMGSKYILIDIPYGKGSKVNINHAKKLKREFETIGKHFRKKIKCILTDGKEPIGNGVGPVLELKDILLVLDPLKKGPIDLQEKCIFLAGELLDLTGKTKKGQGKILAREILESGKAYSKFEEIIKAQKGSIKKFREAKFKKDFFASRNSKIISINNLQIGFLSRILGCPSDIYAGIYLDHHVGHKLIKGEKLFTIYSDSESRLNEAIKFLGRNKIILY